jgi:hypothetical protein
MLVIVYIASNDLFAVTINFLHGKNALTRENFKSCDLLGFYKFSRTEIVREKSSCAFANEASYERGVYYTTGARNLNLRFHLVAICENENQFVLLLKKSESMDKMLEDWILERLFDKCLRKIYNC